jgi:hypothetical protein
MLSVGNTRLEASHESYVATVDYSCLQMFNVFHVISQSNATTMSASSSSNHPVPSNNDNDTTLSDKTCHDFHLQVLGRDGRDLPFFNVQKEHDVHSKKDVTTDDDLHEKEQNHWWNGVAQRFITTATNHTSPQNESSSSTPYSSLVAEEGTYNTKVPLANNTTKNHSKPALLLSTRAASFLTAAQASSPESSASTFTRYSNALQEEEEEITNHHHSKEDDILQESSFFYRDLDDSIMTKPPPAALLRGSSIVLAPSYRSAYHARYQQLNQEYIIENDLALLQQQEEEENYDDSVATVLQPAAARGSIIQDFSNSSLYYKQDGRVLMKLPKDKVRLVMDPELGQAGILSSCCTKNAHEFSDISYILTVPPDIYQKVVLELAHSHTTILSACFASEDRLSIQVAIGLFSVILVLLFINVIIYPGD